MSRVRHYFAYGSNMNPERVAQRGLPVMGANAAYLPGYALRFNKMSREHVGQGHANLQYAPSATTEGVLYELSTAEAIRVMDPFERAPINYGREVVGVCHNGERIWAWTYFANPAVLCEGLMPTREYLAHLLAGRSFLSRDYYAWLASQSTRD